MTGSSTPALPSIAIATMASASPNGPTLALDAALKEMHRCKAEVNNRQQGKLSKEQKQRGATREEAEQEAKAKLEEARKVYYSLRDGTSTRAKEVLSEVGGLILSYTGKPTETMSSQADNPTSFWKLLCPRKSPNAQNKTR
jgi:hypothetical protein